MKKIKVKLPGGATLDVDEYESDIQEDETAAEYNRRLREEEAYDQKLDTFAREVAEKMDSAEQGDRALAYWKVGKLILDHERALASKEESTGLREYETKGRSRQRLMDKVAAIRKGRGAAKERYSVHYLRKFKRFAELLTERQASRPVPYSLQHELIYDWLAEADRDDLLNRCEAGEFRTNMDLRQLVQDMKRARLPGASLGEDQADDTDSPQS